MKKPFFFHCDFYEHFSVLNDEQAGQIIKAVFAYFKNQTETYFTNGFLNAYWQLTKEKVQKMSSLFDKRRLTNKQNGVKGGRPKKTVKNPNNLNNLLIRIALIDKELERRKISRTPD